MSGVALSAPSGHATHPVYCCDDDDGICKCALGYGTVEARGPPTDTTTTDPGRSALDGSTPPCITLFRMISPRPINNRFCIDFRYGRFASPPTSYHCCKTSSRLRSSSSSSCSFIGGCQTQPTQSSGTILIVD